MPYDINNLDKFDKKFKDYNFAVFEGKYPLCKVGETFRTRGSNEDIKKFILQDRQEAYNAGRQSEREKIFNYFKTMKERYPEFNLDLELFDGEILINTINKLKQ
jgi:hypothetical protein